MVFDDLEIDPQSVAQLFDSFPLAAVRCGVESVNKQSVDLVPLLLCLNDAPSAVDPAAQ